jgi:hypothetical protein
MVEGNLQKKGKLAVNRLVLGILYLIMIAIVGGIVLFLFSVPLQTDVGDLGQAIDMISEDPLGAIGLIVMWLISVIIIAVIALAIAFKKRMFVPFKSVEKDADIPKGITVLTIVALGAIISLLLFIAREVVGVFGGDLSQADPFVIGQAILDGNFEIVFIGLIFAIIVGTIVFFVADRTKNVKEVVGKTGIDPQQK